MPKARPPYRAHTTMAAFADDGEVLVGQPAKRQSITNPENTDATGSGRPNLWRPLTVADRASMEFVAEDGGERSPVR